jgi:hypothetical protein
MTKSFIASALLGVSIFAGGCAVAPAEGTSASSSADLAAKISPDLYACAEGQALSCDEPGADGREACACAEAGAATTTTNPRKCPAGERYLCEDLGPTGKPICACQYPDVERDFELSDEEMRCRPGEFVFCIKNARTGQTTCSCQVGAGPRPKETELVMRCPKGERLFCGDLGPKGQVICSCSVS